MLSREVLKPWILEALKAHGGTAPMIEVVKHIWQNHQRGLEDSGDFFFSGNTRCGGLASNSSRSVS
jgi:hypothetical protein